MLFFREKDLSKSLSSKDTTNTHYFMSNHLPLLNVDEKKKKKKH